jgi:simple sugar transport system ATP-binding protein
MRLEGATVVEMLRMEHISKRFGSFYANRDVSLSIREGEVHTLLGENGAGKSTLMNILVGLYQPTGGKILHRGREVRINCPRDAAGLGIGMVHQHFMLVEAMTALENVVLGVKGESPLLSRSADRARIGALSERYGLDVELDSPVRELSIGAQQRVEILKALYRGADLLVLDEPTAVLTDPEVERLFDVMRSLTAEGKSAVFISHKMREVMRISDRITVLRAGKSVATVEVGRASAQSLANLMIGHEFVESVYEKAKAPGEEVMRLADVSLHPSLKHGGLRDVSLTLRRGEILGVAGIDGNGQSQLARVITGLEAPEGGTVVAPDGPVSVFSPEAFIEAGMADIPEDRNAMGLVGDMSVAENLVLKKTDSKRFSYARGAWLKTGAIRAFAEEMREKNDIRCVSVGQAARSLSGGNQQKVILARELYGNPSILVAVYPTRGLDVSATNFVHDVMISERDNGCAIILISADFDEVLKLSDRIIVLFEGRVMGTYPGKGAPVKEISLAMAGK